MGISTATLIAKPGADFNSTARTFAGTLARDHFVNDQVAIYHQDIALPVTTPKIWVRRR